MAKSKNDALEMFGDVSASLLTEEENAATPAVVGPSARDSIGLSKYPLRSIFVADIIQDSDVQFREKPFDPEHDPDDASLLATMGDPSIGLLQPIMVQEIAGTGSDAGPFGQGKKYKMVFGHHRRDSAKMLGWEKIQAHVAKSGEDVSHFTFIENASSHPQTPYELAMTIRKYFDLHSRISQSELANKVGRTQGYINVLLRITEKNTPQALLNLFARGMSYKTASALIPVFIAADPSSYDRLTESLVMCSLSIAEKLAKDVVEHKMDPLALIEMYVVPLKNDHVQDIASSVSGTEEHPLSVEKTSISESVTPGSIDKPDAKPGSSSQIGAVTLVQSQSEKAAPRLPSGIVPTHDPIVT